MFDEGRVSSYEGSEYRERPDNDHGLPFDEKARPARDERVMAAQPFWTGGKIITAMVLAVIVLGAIFCFSQNISIQQRQYDVQAKVGNVWNEVDRASQLLQQNSALLNSTIASQNEAINKIAQARSNASSIKTAQGTTDPNAALEASSHMTDGIRVFVENYPDYGVGSNSHTVLVQLEGSFNRIEYARGQLIKEQTEFNKWLLTQIPMNMFYHPVQILGANANPAEQVPVPHYVQPTP